MTALVLEQTGLFLPFFWFLLLLLLLLLLSLLLFLVLVDSESGTWYKCSV
jgi:hypothetical protein